MKVKYLATVAAAITTMALAGCAQDMGSQPDRMRMMKADGQDCMMRGEGRRAERRDGDAAHDRQDHERESAARGDRGPDQEMAGCRMMGQGKEKPRREARAPEGRDPHADHHPK